MCNAWIRCMSIIYFQYELYPIQWFTFWSYFWCSCRNSVRRHIIMSYSVTLAIHSFVNMQCCYCQSVLPQEPTSTIAMGSWTAIAGCHLFIWVINVSLSKLVRGQHVCKFYDNFDVQRACTLAALKLYSWYLSRERCWPITPPAVSTGNRARTKWKRYLSGLSSRFLMFSCCMQCMRTLYAI